MSRATDRQRLVAQLRRDGQSIRAIGEQLHVSHVTVLRDIRTIEQQSGDPIAVNYVRGQDGKFYLPKVTVQDYEVEEGYDEPAEPQDLTSTDHLVNALSSLQMAALALQVEGVRNAEVRRLLAEVRQEAAHVTAANKALPTKEVTS